MSDEKRREFSKATKAAATQRATRADGYVYCERCLRRIIHTDDIPRIRLGAYLRYDHDDPDWFARNATHGHYRSNALQNCRLVCRPCDRAKTKKDQQNIAKAKRIHQRHLGIRKQSRFSCSRASPFKKKLTGKVVKR